MDRAYQTVVVQEIQTMMLMSRAHADADALVDCPTRWTYASIVDSMEQSQRRPVGPRQPSKGRPTMFSLSG